MLQIETSPLGTQRIIKPSGVRVNAKTLQEGKRYLHKKLWLFRKINYFVGNDVSWTDYYGSGVCTKQSFAQMCSNEATPEEVEFIIKQLNNLYSKGKPL